MSNATTAVFLYIGAERALERLSVEKRIVLLEPMDGFTSLVDWLADLAERVEKIYGDEHAAFDFPGVYDYEVTQYLGEWAVENWEKVMTDPLTFDAELRRHFHNWINEAANHA